MNPLQDLWPVCARTKPAAITNLDFYLECSAVMSDTRYVRIQRDLEVMEDRKHQLQIAEISVLVVKEEDGTE